MKASLATIRVKEEHLEEFLVGMRAHAQASLAEPGCVRFDVMQDAEEPTLVYLWEVFRDEAANEAHTASDHSAQWRETSRGWRAPGDPFTFGLRRVVNPISVEQTG